MNEIREPDEIRQPDADNGDGDPGVTTVEVTRSSFSGPLPPPELFRQYEEVSPGTGKEIVEMAKVQRNHDHDMERRATEILKGHLPRRESTMRLALVLVAVTAVSFIAAFCFTVFWDAATWEPYGVGGFIVFWPLAVSIYRLIISKRK